MIFDTIFVEAENDDVGETDLRVTNARGGGGGGGGEGIFCRTKKRRHDAQIT